MPYLLPKYLPSSAEIVALKERIFRENVSRGKIRQQPVAKGPLRSNGIGKRAL